MFERWDFKAPAIKLKCATKLFESMLKFKILNEAFRSYQFIFKFWFDSYKEMQLRKNILF